jgi:drug/metabolite transporter (DMT)-like permease
LVSAVAVAVEIVFISGFAGTLDIRRITAVHLGIVALLSLASMPLMGEALPSFSRTLAVTAGGLGLMSAVIQLTMNWARKSVSPTRATVTYAGEPVWAGIVGRIAGERLPALALVGCALIVAGVIVSEMKPQTKPGAT